MTSALFHLPFIRPRRRSVRFTSFTHYLRPAQRPVRPVPSGAGPDRLVPRANGERDGSDMSEVRTEERPDLEP